MSERDEIRLRTGRILRASHSILGLDESLRLYDGYDGMPDEDRDAGAPEQPWLPPRFTSEERRELADRMIALWNRWAAKK